MRTNYKLLYMEFEFFQKPASSFFSIIIQEPACDNCSTSMCNLSLNGLFLSKCKRALDGFNPFSEDLCVLFILNCSVSQSIILIILGAVCIASPVHILDCLLPSRSDGSMLS